MTQDRLAEAGSFYAALRSAAGQDWRAYTEHAFVEGLGDGSLPEAAFKHYLVQDYIFLIHFARCYALGVYKAETVEEMRHCQGAVSAILDEELSLHIAYCRDWGLDEAAILKSAEDPSNVAYTRYVLDRGMAGDYVELLVALAPCAIGYAEIGQRLLSANTTKREGNPYLPWIEAYGGEAFQDLALSSVRHLQSAAERRFGGAPEKAARFARMDDVFRQATRLEIGFWQMGLDAVD